MKAGSTEIGKLIIVLVAGGWAVGSSVWGAEFADGPDVISLLHMESTVTYGGGRVQTVDDDSTYPARNHHLVMGASGDTSLPQLVAGGLYGKALSLDGVNDNCSVMYWINGVTNRNIAVDVSFKATSVGGSEQTIASMGATTDTGFELLIEADGKLTWQVWGSGGFCSVQTDEAVSAGEWHTVSASIANHALSLQVDGAAPIVKAYDGYLTCHSRPFVGSRAGTGRFFGGLVDEVRLAAVPFVDHTNTVGLWHMEAVATYGATRQQTLDDDSANPGRDRHLVMGASDDLALPQLVTGGCYGNYGKALSLDGVNDLGYVMYWLNGITNQTIAVDVSFKAVAVGTTTQTLISVGTAVDNGFELRIEPDGKLTWAVWASGGPDSIQSANVISAGVWTKVRAALAPNALSLRVEGSAPVIKPYTGQLTCNSRIFIGCNILPDMSPTRYFAGLVDELRIEGAVPEETLRPSGTLIVIR